MEDLVVEKLLEAAQLHKSRQWRHTSVLCETSWLTALGMFPEVSFSCYFIPCSDPLIPKCLWWTRTWWMSQESERSMWPENAWSHMDCLSALLSMSESESTGTSSLLNFTSVGVIAQFCFFCLAEAWFFLSTSKELRQHQQLSGMANLIPAPNSLCSTATFSAMESSRLANEHKDPTVTSSTG